MQGLPAREAAAEGVPPSEAILSPLPTQVDDVVPDLGREVDEASMEVLHLAAEGQDHVDVGLDGAVEIRLLLEQRCVGLSFLRPRVREALAVIRLRIFHEFSKLTRPRHLWV